MQRWGVQRILSIAALTLGLAVVLCGWGLYHRPAHHYNTTYEPCWQAAALVALGTPSTFAPTFCGSPQGTLPGVGPLTTTRAYRARSGHDTVIFTTAQSTDRGVEGLAYVAGEPPPSDSCVFHLGGPWWQLAFENNYSTASGWNQPTTHNHFYPTSISSARSRSSIK